MVRLMQNEMDRIGRRRAQGSQYEQPNGKGDPYDPEDENRFLNYEDLFKVFVLKRKVKLLRFLFSLDRKVFDFSGDLFLKALEMECYDMAALLFKEFFRLLRHMDPQ